MQKLISIEFKKIVNFRTFWVLAIIHIALYLLLCLIISRGKINFNWIDIKIFLQFPDVWQFFAWIASWFNIFLAIIIITIICPEFQYRTFRQHIINGLTYREIIFAKIVVIFILAFVIVFIVFISAFIIGLIFSNNISIFLDKIYYLGIYFIQLVGFMCAGMFFAFILKNTALALILFIVYYFPVEPILRTVFFKPIKLYFPMKVISDLTPAPNFMEKSKIIIQNMPDMQKTLSQSLSLQTNLILALIYIFIFVILSYMIIRYRDL